MRASASFREHGSTANCVDRALRLSYQEQQVIDAGRVLALLRRQPAGVPFSQLQVVTAFGCSRDMAMKRIDYEVPASRTSKRGSAHQIERKYLERWLDEIVLGWHGSRLYPPCALPPRIHIQWFGASR